MIGLTELVFFVVVVLPAGVVTNFLVVLNKNVENVVLYAFQTGSEDQSEVFGLKSDQYIGVGSAGRASSD